MWIITGRWSIPKLCAVKRHKVEHIAVRKTYLGQRFTAGTYDFILTISLLVEPERKTIQIESVKHLKEYDRRIRYRGI